MIYSLIYSHIIQVTVLINVDARNSCTYSSSQNNKLNIRIKRIEKPIKNCEFSKNLNIIICKINTSDWHIKNDAISLL